MRWKCNAPIPAASASSNRSTRTILAVADVVAEWKKTPGTVGIRIMLTKENGRAATHPGLERIARAAVRYDFPVNLLCWDNLDEGTALIDRNPETRFIIDHLAILQPRTPPAPPQPSLDQIWADLPKVLELAKRPNVVIKVSGACTLSREPYPFPDIWDPLARVFDAWGFERCLWGTDWTRAFAVVNYQQAVTPFRDRPPERHRARDADGRRLRKAYGWSPNKGFAPRAGVRRFRLRRPRRSARGDFDMLVERERRVLRVHLDDLESGLSKLEQAFSHVFA